MPRGKRLTEREIGKIEALEKEGKSQRGIARQLERSLACICIQHFLKNRENYGKVKRAGRKKSIPHEPKDVYLMRLLILQKAVTSSSAN